MCDILTNSIVALTTKKKETLVLPDQEQTDSSSTLPDHDPDLEVTSGRDSDGSYGPWTLGINRRICLTPYGSLRLKRSAPESSDDPAAIFLPKTVYCDEDLIFGNV